LDADGPVDTVGRNGTTGTTAVRLMARMTVLSQTSVDADLHGVAAIRPFAIGDQPS
jgi:hypothetical protein